MTPEEERERRLTRMLDEEETRGDGIAKLFEAAFADDSFSFTWLTRQERVRVPRPTPTAEERARAFADWLDGGD